MKYTSARRDLWNNLDAARAFAADINAAHINAARAIGLPPSCVAVVRDAECEGRYVVKLIGAFSNEMPIVK